MSTAVRPGRDPATYAPFERWVAEQVQLGHHPDAAVDGFLASLTAAERIELQYAWTSLWARPNQVLPDGEWDTLFIRAGRGYGKTRTGAEGVRKLVCSGRARAVTLIAPTAADARDVMIENPESGLLVVHPQDVRPTYKPSIRSLEWPNGAIGYVRSAEEPDGLRGLNSDLVWGDEPASWKSGSAAWDNAQLGNRLGRPHSILTGTPRPLPWLREIEQAAGTIVRTGSTYENITNLAPSFIRLILARYENSRLGAQELHAQYLEDVEGALWRMAAIEAARLVVWDQRDPWGSLVRALTPEVRAAAGLGAFTLHPRERRPWEVWVGVDPPGETAECGIVVATAPKGGKAGEDHAVVLDDMSTEGAPEVWGAQVVAAIRKYGAVGAVVESNQGGDMTRATIHNVDPNVRVDKVRASESKADRAEPVSVLYPQWIHHHGILSKLESQQTTWVPDESKSPDRLDALVHVITKLLRPQLGRRGKASVHSPIPRAARTPRRP